MSLSIFRWPTLLLLFLFVCVASPASLQAQAPSEPGAEAAPPAADLDKRKEEAKLRFQRGLELVQNESWDAALAEFLASRKLFPTRVALKNGALSLRQLKRYVEALAMYNELVSSFGASIPPEERKTIDDAIAQLKNNVGEVLVESDQPGSIVVVDGQQQGTTPLPAIGVNAGTHTVRVAKEGYEAFEAQVLVAGGQRETVRGKLKALSTVGRLVVRESGGKVLDVVVDGAVVGKTPRYEGVVAVGAHTVFLRGEGNLGTAPSQASVKENQATTLTLAAVELDAEVRIEPVPSNARVFVDGVQLGNGVWEGRLQSGSHQIELAGDGFVAYRKQVKLVKGKRELIKVTLERDLSNPMWQAGFVPHLYAELFGGGMLALSLGGSADQACSDGKCSEQSLPLGFAAGGRAGYQFVKGFSVELGFGFMYLGEKMTREVEATGEHDVVFRSTNYKDETTFAAPFVAASAAYQLLDKTPLTFRIAGGAARAKATFKNGGTFVGDISPTCENPAFPDCDPTETASVSQNVAIAEQPANLWVPFAAPEVRFGYRISKKLTVDFGVALYVMLPPETIRSDIASSDAFSVKRGEGQRRARIRDVEGAYTSTPEAATPGLLSLNRETGLGVLLAIMPSLAVHFDF